jgi:hypothetical protein
MSEWRLARRKADMSSFWRHVADGEGVTVFETAEGGWKWVFDGEFSEAFDTCEAAMGAAEDELDLE